MSGSLRYGNVHVHINSFPFHAASTGYSLAYVCTPTVRSASPALLRLYEYRAQQSPSDLQDIQLLESPRSDTVRLLAC